jgi:hypothetical protein
MTGTQLQHRAEDHPSTGGYPKKYYWNCVMNYLRGLKVKCYLLFLSGYVEVGCYFLREIMINFG